MISHHPSQELLGKFASGDLDSLLSSVVSAHVEHCSECKNSVKNLEVTFSNHFFRSSSIETAHHDFADAWKNLSAQLNSTRSPELRPVAQATVTIDGLNYELPTALRSLHGAALKWSAFGKGGKICKVGAEGTTSLFLIFLAANQEVPLHSHAGTEHSYVVAGSFGAGGAEYHTGDFAVATVQDTHAPRAGSEDGCLLLSRVENRLNFLQGIFKHFNSLLWWILSLRMK